MCIEGAAYNTSYLKIGIPECGQDFTGLETRDCISVGTIQVYLCEPSKLFDISGYYAIYKLHCSRYRSGLRTAELCRATKNLSNANHKLV